MRRVASQLKDSEFLEHIEDMQLTLFRDNKLDEDEREEVFKHLAQCKRCRDVLKVASEIEQEEKRLKPVNNINFMGIIKPFIPLVAGVVIFLGVPAIYNQAPDVSFKGVCEEKGIIDKSMEYWEALFDEIFGGDK